MGGEQELAAVRLSAWRLEVYFGTVVRRRTLHVPYI